MRQGYQFPRADGETTQILINPVVRNLSESVLFTFIIISIVELRSMVTRIETNA